MLLNFCLHKYGTDNCPYTWSPWSFSFNSICSQAKGKVREGLHATTNYKFAVYSPTVTGLYTSDKRLTYNWFQGNGEWYNKLLFTLLPLPYSAVEFYSNFNTILATAY